VLHVLSDIRKIITFVDECQWEAGGELDRPWQRVASVAVVANPWVGQAFVENLSPGVARIAPILARELSMRIVRALGGADFIEAFGKGVVVGLDGEVENGAALIHNPHLGDGVRHYLNGKSLLPFTETRGEAGAVLAVPMWHKDTYARRSHYQAVEVRVPDAPRRDEIVIAVVAASGSRPLARIGDRTTDEKVEIRV
jgi:hypothetical protein